MRMKQPPRSAFEHIESIRHDSETPVGHRLVALRDIRDALDKAERFLSIQLGIDLAKDLFARGVQPTGRPLGETFREMDAAAARIAGDATGRE